MSMNVRTAIGIAALALAIAALFAGGVAIWVSMAALFLAAILAAQRSYVWALATLAVVVANTFFIEPTLWSVSAGTERAGRDRSVDAVRIILLALTAAPLIAMGVNHVHTRTVKWIIAGIALALLVTFLAVIAWNVTLGPLITVFAIAVVMGAYDFSRELRGIKGTPTSATDAVSTDDSQIPGSSGNRDGPA